MAKCVDCKYCWSFGINTGHCAILGDVVDKRVETECNDFAEETIPWHSSSNLTGTISGTIAQPDNEGVSSEQFEQLRDAFRAWSNNPAGNWRWA